jgi:predicted dinucleotide-binding enzyme
MSPCFMLSAMQAYRRWVRMLARYNGIFHPKELNMRIALIGAGNVGGTLGKRWARADHEVAFGVRDPADPKLAALLKESGSSARAASVPEAVRQAEVVVLTVPWGNAREALTAAGDLGGRILIDATNPVPLTAEGLRQGLVIGHTTSGAEEIARWTGSARVVKAFNTTGFQNMANPKYGTQGLTMMLCGDDAEAKKTAGDLARQLGFDPVDVGPLRSARYLEGMAMLWIDMAVLRGFGTNFGFQVVKR